MCLFQGAATAVGSVAMQGHVTLTVAPADLATTWTQKNAKVVKNNLKTQRYLFSNPALKQRTLFLNPVPKQRTLISDRVLKQRTLFSDSVLSRIPCC